MTAPFKESKENYRAFFASDDWVRASLERLDGKKKAGRFYYAALIGPDILTGLLANCTHERVIDYARKQLFEPLGIAINQSIQFASEKEQLDWYNEKMRECGWVAGPTGVNTGGWGLVLKACDMAKIGQLYLQKGSWEGKQIVSKEWIKESTSKKSHFDEMGYDYGYLWWLIDEKERSFAAFIFFCSGYGLMKNLNDKLEYLQNFLSKRVLQGIYFCHWGHFTWWAGEKNWWLRPDGFATAKWWMQERTTWFFDHKSWYAAIRQLSFSAIFSKCYSSKCASGYVPALADWKG